VAAYLPAFSEHLMAPLRSVAIAALVTGAGMVALPLIVATRRSRSRRRRRR
jgi:hypothetical protein